MNEANKDIYLEFRCLFDLRAATVFLLDPKWLAEQIAADTWRGRQHDRFWELGASFTETEYALKLSKLTMEEISEVVRGGIPLYTPVLSYIRKLISTVQWEPYLPMHSRSLNLCLDFGGLAVSAEEQQMFRSILEGSVQPYVKISFMNRPLWCSTLSEVVTGFGVAFLYRLEERWVKELEEIECPSRYVILPKLAAKPVTDELGTLDVWTAVEFSLTQRLSLRYEDVENYSLGWRVAKKQRG